MSIIIQVHKSSKTLKVSQHEMLWVSKYTNQVIATRKTLKQYNVDRYLGFSVSHSKI